MPCFFILGSPNSGKTSCLKQAGFHFFKEPQLDENIKPVECWFSDEAIFVESSVLTSSHGNAQEHWEQALDILASFKKKYIIRGILFTINYSVLRDEPNLAEWLQSMVCRIGELYRRLEVCIPVHLLITHCDKIPGFDAFFRHLPPHERQQVWGLQTINESLRIEWAMQCLENLHQQAQAMLISQIHLHDGIEEKLSLFQFTGAFSDIKKPIQSVLESFSRKSIYQDNIVLSGLYFTSTRVEKEYCCSYFVRDLFKRHLLTSENTSYPSTYKKRTLFFYLRYKWYGLGGICMLFVFLFTVGYVKQIKLVRDGLSLAKKGMTVH